MTKRLEFWIVLIAVAFAIVFGLTGCEARIQYADEPMRKPEPEASRMISEYRIDSKEMKALTVLEFRDSAGRVCVFVASGYSGLLDCGYPVAHAAAELPPLEYEALPGYEKRPL